MPLISDAPPPPGQHPPVQSPAPSPADTLPHAGPESARVLAPSSILALQELREQVRAASEPRKRLLARHPAPAPEPPPRPEAIRAAARIEARLTALDPAVATSGGGARDAPESVLSEMPPGVHPAVLHRIAEVVHAKGMEAEQAQAALESRVRLIRPSAATRVVRAVTAPDVATPAQAAASAAAALGQPALTQEAEAVGRLASAAWSGSSALQRVTDRAAVVLEMAGTASTGGGPGAAPAIASEVLREVDRRMAEIRRADLAARAWRDHALFPTAEPRMQSGGVYPDIRSIDCLRCGTTRGREDGRARLSPDGTLRLDADGNPERFHPRDGELCTPCWLSGAPMSVPELKLRQRESRLIEATQVHFRPGQVGWEERAAEWTARDRARRTLVDPVEERLDAPSPWVVVPSPAEVGNRRTEELLEREAAREEALERSQWDLPGDREADWWDLKFSGMGDAAGRPPELSAERRLELETARLAEAQRRLRAVVGVEDPALRRVLETEADVRLHLGQGSAIREAWETTRGIPRADLRAVAREQVEQRLRGPDALLHHRRLREARGLPLPTDMAPAVQATIRARQIERVLADLDVPSLVGRLQDLARTAERPGTACAAEAVLDGLAPALGDRRLEGAVAQGRLAETVRPDRTAFHSGIDEAVLPGERRGEAHARGLDRWLKPQGGTAAAFSREVGDLNPRGEIRDHRPSKPDGTLPWQLAERDRMIAAEVREGGMSAPDRILSALEQYGAEAAARGSAGEQPFGDDVRERLIEAAARQAGFTQGEVDRLWEVHRLAGGVEDPAAFDQLMREAGAWTGQPGSDPARLRDALASRSHGGARLVFSAEDLGLVARAERAAAPYLEYFDQARAQWSPTDPEGAPATEEPPTSPASADPATPEPLPGAPEDPDVAVIRDQVAALRAFERLDPAYQDAMRQIDRAETILAATREAREAAFLAWSETKRTLSAQFSHPERLLARVWEMDAAEVREIANALRANPLALSANHPRTGGVPRIPGVNAAGAAERLEPALKTVRAQGLRGLLGQPDAGHAERQARIAAVALETWAAARSRGEETRTWAATQLALPADTPLTKVGEAAQARLAELTREHQDLVRSWREMAPAPTLGEIERQINALHPESARRARAALPELDTRQASRPAARSLPQPALSR